MSSAKGKRIFFPLNESSGSKARKSQNRHITVSGPLSKAKFLTEDEDNKASVMSKTSVCLRINQLIFLFPRF